VQLDSADIAPQASTTVSLGANLDATGTVPVTSFDITESDQLQPFDLDLV